jgi:nicotinamidase-related amidase
MKAGAALDPTYTALVVVDLQERLMPAIQERDTIVRNTTLLLRLARALELPVVATTQYAKGLGPTLSEIARELPAGDPLDKVSFGGFGSDAFCARLEALGDRRQLLVTGVESHICVTQTVLGALARAYTVHVASDAVGARTAYNHRIGLARMEHAGAVLSSTEMAIYELLGRSDSAAFKTMLPLLRR